MALLVRSGQGFEHLLFQAGAGGLVVTGQRRGRGGDPRVLPGFQRQLFILTLKALHEKPGFPAISMIGPQETLAAFEAAAGKDQSLIEQCGPLFLLRHDGLLIQGQGQLQAGAQGRHHVWRQGGARPGRRLGEQVKVAQAPGLFWDVSVLHGQGEHQFLHCLGTLKPGLQDTGNEQAGIRYRLGGHAHHPLEAHQRHTCLGLCLGQLMLVHQSHCLAEMFFCL
ncbi:MAG: hypothetical protein JWO94_111 [Verrucomicrobiaceae bacterium]|nr:hypothetical protein [Verrucomicrobiaceae bacterium]